MARRKTITNKVFIETAEKAAAEGKSPETALVEASQKAYGHDRAMPAVARQELGLDDLELQQAFGRRIAKRYLDADDGIFPDYIMELSAVDPVACVKAKLEYLKTMKGDLASAFIMKQERRVVETEDTHGRSDEEIEHRIKHGRWPEEMTLDGKPN